MKLVVVESPTKSRTLKKFLGKDYQIAATFGHIRDLPEKKFGVDIKKDFEPKYVTISKSRKVIRFLKKLAKKSKLAILATDSDREGEAIAWHLTQILGLNGETPYQRIIFHEITKPAIEEALKNPRKIDMDLVDAQQARRILDRIVGYKLSPFLWKKVARGLSAGRVQSVAVRLVVEREREIENFIPQEYWTIAAHLKKMEGVGSLSTEFEALLVKKDRKVIPKLGIKTKKEVDKILRDLEGAEYKVVNIEKKETKRNPFPPFMTSTLQQEAWKRFRWPARFTMRIAQNLYERGENLELLELLMNAYILPHGGGYDFRDVKDVLDVLEYKDQRYFVTTLKSNISRLKIIRNVGELQFEYRGRDIVLKTLQLDLGDIIARLNPLFSLKL